MKRLIAILVALVALTIFNSKVIWAVDFIDTTLDSPYAVTNPAVKLRQYDFYWGPDSFKATMNFLDASGNTVAHKVCTLQDWVELITPASCSDPQYSDQATCELNSEVWTAAVTQDHNDFSDGANAVVISGKVGETYKSVIAGYIQTRCKTNWSLTGTE